MKIPSNFKSQIAAAFYDKEIDILESSVETTNTGWKKELPGDVSSSFNGNVRFDKLAELQEEQGIKETIDIAITCDTEEPVEIGTFLGYINKQYRAVQVIPFDTHKLILAKLWSLTSSTLPSA